MTIIIDLFWFIVMAVISYRMPPYVDDYLHQNSFADGSVIESISQIFPSVSAYYNTWGGRAVSMFFIQLMLMLPKIVFALCNAGFFLANGHIINRYASIGKRNWKNNPLQLGLIYLFLWFFMPDFSEVMTWATGSITYLWTNFFLLAFGYLFYRDYYENSEKANLRNILCYVFFGFLAGQSNEAGACTMIFAIIIFVVFSLYNKKHIYLHQILGICALIIGTATLILAPGNRIRISEVEASSAASNVIKNYLFRFARETFYGVMFLMIPLAICIGLYFIRQKKSWKDKGILFAILALVSIYVMTFSAGFANRIYQLPLLLLTIVFSISIDDIWFNTVNPIICKMDQSDKFISNIKRSITAFIAAMMLMVVFEVVAGTIYAESRKSFFDRQMIYYHIYDNEGALSGNGIQN